METEIAWWPNYYGDLEVEVFAPQYYIQRSEKEDDYSAKIIFGKNTDYSDYFLEKVYSVFAELQLELDMIVTIPSSRIGKFSPTMLALGKKLSRKLSIKNKNIIKRVKEGKKLTNCKDYDERHSQIEDSYIVTKKLDGERIALLDDTRTTGMTLLECAKILKEAGASEVVAVCLGINK